VGKNGKRYLRQAESSVVRFLITRLSYPAETFKLKLSKGWQLRMYTLGYRFYIPKFTGGSV
jgi:hypothetical protein